MSFIFDWIYSGFSSVLQFLGKFLVFGIFPFCYSCIKCLFTSVIFKHSCWLNTINTEYFRCMLSSRSHIHPLASWKKWTCFHDCNKFEFSNHTTCKLVWFSLLLRSFSWFFSVVKNWTQLFSSVLLHVGISLGNPNMRDCLQNISARYRSPCSCSAGTLFCDWCHRNWCETSLASAEEPQEKPREFTIHINPRWNISLWKTGRNTTGRKGMLDTKKRNRSCRWHR